MLVAYFLLFWTSHCVLTPGGEPVGRTIVEQTFLDKSEEDVEGSNPDSTPSVVTSTELLLLLGVTLFDARR